MFLWRKSGPAGQAEGRERGSVGGGIPLLSASSMMAAAATHQTHPSPASCGRRNVSCELPPPPIPSGERKRESGNAGGGIKHAEVAEEVDVNAVKSGDDACCFVCEREGGRD